MWNWIIGGLFRQFWTLKIVSDTKKPTVTWYLFSKHFHRGLKPTIKPFVWAFKPTTLSEAMEYAILQEESILASRNVMKSLTNFVKPMGSQYKPPILPTPTPQGTVGSGKNC